MAQLVSHRPSTAEAWVPCRSGPVRARFLAKTGAGRDFPAGCHPFPHNTIPAVLHSDPATYTNSGHDSLINSHLKGF